MTALVWFQKTLICFASQLVGVLKWFELSCGYLEVKQSVFILENARGLIFAEPMG